MTAEKDRLRQSVECSKAQERPLLIDLCCKAGGASEGYYRAGFDVLGVDIEPQPHYPFPFIQGDALKVGSALIATGRVAAAAGSPPCWAHTDLQKQNKRSYVDLIPDVRAMFAESGLPYVIENVEGAPLLDPTWLCGCMFPALRVYRKRGFESNFPMPKPRCSRHVELTFTHDKRKAHYGVPLDLTTMRVQVTGGGNAPVWAKAQAMGIDWMTGSELNQAIPPAYSEWVGRYLMREVQRRETVRTAA